MSIQATEEDWGDWRKTIKAGVPLRITYHKCCTLCSSIARGKTGLF